MTREEATALVIDKLKEIQENSRRAVGEITVRTRPIGDLEGFDSLNGAELAHVICDAVPLGEMRNICASEDGTRALTVREIVDCVIKSAQAQGEVSNG